MFLKTCHFKMKTTLNINYKYMQLEKEFLDNTLIEDVIKDVAQFFKLEPSRCCLIFDDELIPNNRKINDLQLPDEAELDLVVDFEEEESPFLPASAILDQKDSISILVTSDWDTIMIVVKKEHTLKKLFEIIKDELEIDGDFTVTCNSIELTPSDTLIKDTCIPQNPRITVTEKE